MKRNKALFFTIALMFNGLAVFGQPSLEWVAPQVGTTSGDASTSYSMYVDAVGNVYTVGRFAGTIDFDPSPAVNNVTSVSGLDVYISKKDVSGNLVWIKNFGSSSVAVYEMSGDDSGNIYITGQFQNTIDFDPGVGTANLSSNGSYDAFVLKLNSAGVYQWAKSVGGSNFDRARSLHFDEVSNQLLVAGDFSGTVDFDPSVANYNITSNSTDAFLLSLNASGDFQWMKQFGGTSAEYIEGVRADATGNIFITGYFFSDIDVDPGVAYQGLTAVGNSDAFVCKLQNNGDLIWSKQLGGGTMNTRSWDINLDIDGSIIFTGYFNDAISFVDVNSTSIDLTTNGGYDIFTCKLNAIGGIVWVTQIGGTGTDNSQTVFSRNGIVYVGGSYSSIVDFDNGPGVFQLPSAGSGTNACLYALSSDGNYLWANSFGNSGGALTTDEILGVQVDDQGAVFASGYFTGTSGTTDLDPGLGSFNVQGALDNHNAFTIKLGCAPVTSTDIASETCPYTWIDGITYYSDNSTASWTLMNQFGCDSVVTLNLTLTDGVAPVPNVASLNAINGPCGQNVTSLTAPTATDNCAGTITGTHNVTLPITASTTITWTYNDGNGNITTQNQTVTINPLDNASFNYTLSNYCPGFFSVSPAITGLAGGTFTSSPAGLAINSSTGEILEGFSNLGPYTVTYTTSGACPNSSSQEISISGSPLPPNVVSPITVCTGEDVILQATGSGFGDVYYFNNSGTLISTIAMPPAATTTNIGTLPVGNYMYSAMQQFSGGCPSPPSNISINVVNYDDATFSYSAATFCPNSSDPIPSITGVSGGMFTSTAGLSIDPSSGVIDLSASIPNSYNVTYTTSGACSNSSIFNLFIGDNQDPIFDNSSLGDVVTECSVTSLTAPTATDNCAGTITGTHDATLPITAQGTTIVTWTYDDGNGNTSSQAQSVVITPIDNSVTQDDDVTLSANASGFTYQWIDCTNGNQEINGETAQTFVATSNGSYAVVIDNGTCSVTSTCMVINQVGIEESGNNALVEVYPNPTNGTIYLESSSKIEKIEITNPLGQRLEVHEIADSLHHIFELPEINGVYFIRIFTNSTTVLKRIVKN